MARYAMDAALRTQILAVAGVSAIVATRLYPDVAPQDEPAGPYGVMTLSGDATRGKRLNGGLMKTITARYLIQFFAPTRAAVLSLAALVTARQQDGGIDGFRGTMGSGVTAAYVQRCIVENREDGSVEDESGGEDRSYFASFDAVATFNE